jgi:hypothetical protein
VVHGLGARIGSLTCVPTLERSRNNPLLAKSMIRFQELKINPAMRNHSWRLINFNA